MDKRDILIKISQLTNKWKGKVPEENTNMWWRYRADQIYCRSLMNKLKKFGENETQKTLV